MAVIFATSCTVISRPAFVDAVGRVLPGPMLRGLWGQLWYSCGLLVVKGYHVAEFVLLYRLVTMAVGRLDRTSATSIGVALCLCFAISDEWHQTFVPGRGGTWTDVVIDMSGVILIASIEQQRAFQGMLILSVLGLSWLGMQVVHEAGHVLLAWCCGEKVSRVVLDPLSISRTDASHDLHPLLLIWGGPVLGSILPLMAFGVARRVRPGVPYLFGFFAGFCLVANGLYLGVGSFEGVGDAGDLLRNGAPRWTLIAFGLVATPLGLWFWDGLGPSFGLGEARGRVSRRAALGTLGLFIVLVLVEELAGSRP